ncbi:BHLH domain-containing protein [Psidium guajava]|nr:BHLH domain-containing protein [Psidium guajava]
MSILNPGVLVRLLEGMKAKEMACEDRKAAVLQIRSIMPVLSEGELWPNGGFYVKVSDASHAMNVSLPQEQDDLILCNKLHLGQYVYADRMEASHPVPVLKGVRPIPGRNLCSGAPKDLVPLENLVEIWAESDPESIKEMIDSTEEKPKQSVNASRAKVARKNCGRAANGLSRKCGVGRTLSDSDGLLGWDKNSDSDSTISSCSETSTTKRRSWNGVDSTRIDISKSRILKHKLKPISISHDRCRYVSPVQSLHESSSARSNSKTMNKNISVATKSIRTLKSRNSGTSKKGEVPLDPAALFSAVLNRKRTEDKILWSSLPSSLMKLGKEVLKQRDAALLASVEALQEASAAERLLKCLSAYSELQSSNSEEEQPSVDKFFKLQDDMAHSRLVIQSLTNDPPTRAAEIEPNNANSPREAFKLALDRKRNAILWIKAAMASDLVPLSTTARSGLPSIEATKAFKRSCVGSADGVPKRKHKNCEIMSGVTSENHKLEWSKGSPSSATADLANSLQDESRTLFLAYVEQYLDGLKSQFSIEAISNSQTIHVMRQVKRVSDWLDIMAKKEASYAKIGCRGSSDLEDPEFEVYSRVRNKIYRILLMHIEKTALAWESTNTAAET